MQIAGVDNEQVFFMLEDHNLTDPNFLGMFSHKMSLICNNFWSQAFWQKGQVNLLHCS